jgi:hypothetical protein
MSRRTLTTNFNAVPHADSLAVAVLFASSLSIARIRVKYCACHIPECSLVREIGQFVLDLIK